MRWPGWMPQVLLPSQELGTAQRWSLVDWLYRQRTSLVQGSVSLAVMAMTCTFASGRAVFTVMACMTLIVMALRVWLSEIYLRRNGNGPEQDSRTPEYWALRFAIGATATGLCGGMTSWLALVEIRDPSIHTIIFMVGSGFIAGASIRNAASPAAVAGQTVTAVLPAIAGALQNGTPSYRLTAVFFIVMLTAIRSIVLYLGRQLETMLLSEQRVIEVNQRLTATCSELEQANARLLQLSSTDALTEIGNRRAFDSALTMEWGRAQREQGMLSLLLIDVDLFKAFNDFYGHPAGDTCLRLIADTLEHCLRRPPDFAGRFGGEEFVALLPGIEIDGAVAVAERIRVAVMEAHVPHARSPFGTVTVSIGVASASPHEGKSHLDLIASADQALYRAKQAGRNRIESTQFLGIVEVRKPAARLSAR